MGINANFTKEWCIRYNHKRNNSDFLQQLKMQIGRWKLCRYRETGMTQIEYKGIKAIDFNK